MADDAPPQPPGPEEFERLYAVHSREVWALAYSRRMDPDLARDVMQEAFLRLWRAWQAGDTVHNPRAWLLKVARNLAEDLAKSAFRKNGTQGSDFMIGVPSRLGDPSEALTHEDQLRQLRAEMKRMAEPDREVLTFRYALGYDVDKIADLLGTSVAAVHMRLSRARQRLAERLTALGANDPG